VRIVGQPIRWADVKAYSFKERWIVLPQEVGKVMEWDCAGTNFHDRRI